MKRIYITGHGVMAQGYGDAVILRHTLHTYCANGAMLEGGVGSTSIVDTGVYNPAHASSRAVAQHQVFRAGNSVPTHYVYGGTSLLGDYSRSVKWAAARAMGLQANKIVLGNNVGDLFKLSADEYLYCAKAACLIGLNKIQTETEVKFPKQSLELHWVACRSHIPSGSAGKMLTYIRNYGADGGGVTTMVR